MSFFDLPHTFLDVSSLVYNTIFDSWYARLWLSNKWKAYSCIYFFISSYSHYIFVSSFSVLSKRSHTHRHTRAKGHSFSLALPLLQPQCILLSSLGSVCLSCLLSITFSSAFHSNVHIQTVQCVLHIHSFFIGSALLSRVGRVCCMCCLLPLSAARQPKRVHLRDLESLCVETHTHTVNENTQHTFCSPLWKNKNMRSDFSSYRAMFGVGSTDTEYFGPFPNSVTLFFLSRYSNTHIHILKTW